MDRNSSPLADVGQRVGFFAYMTVMSGGRPFWPALFETTKTVDELAASVARPDGSAGSGGAFAATVPYEHQAGPKDTIAA